jgi:hypothetical protein
MQRDITDQHIIKPPLDVWDGSEKSQRQRRVRFRTMAMLPLFLYSYCISIFWSLTLED